jgi:hypothetical protein
MMTLEEKRSKVYSFLDSLNQSQIGELMSWAHPRLTWYAGANILHSESQLDEIIAKLEEITRKR